MYSDQAGERVPVDVEKQPPMRGQDSYAARVEFSLLSDNMTRLHILCTATNSEGETEQQLDLVVIGQIFILKLKSQNSR